MAHFNSKGYLKTAQHEGKVAAFSKQPESSCPYRGGIVESSWRYGFNNPQESIFD